MSAAKCVGALGAALGHKFRCYLGCCTFHHCQRCGMPKGGWKK